VSLLQRLLRGAAASSSWSKTASSSWSGPAGFAWSGPAGIAERQAQVPFFHC